MFEYSGSELAKIGHTNQPRIRLKVSAKPREALLLRDPDRDRRSSNELSTSYMTVVVVAAVASVTYAYDMLKKDEMRTNETDHRRKGTKGAFKLAPKRFAFLCILVALI